MESLNLSTQTGGNNSSPSAGGASSGGNGPLGIRFTTTSDDIDDAYSSFHNNSSSNCSGTSEAADLSNSNAGGDSPAGSPSNHHQLNDEVNSINFLQGGFFNRKRSGSIEGGVSPTTSGPNLIAAISSNDASSVGTWKLIKGKVSQTIEDMKSSKSSNVSLSSNPSITTVSYKVEPAQTEGDSDQENITITTSLAEDLPKEHQGKEKVDKPLQQHKTDSDSEGDSENLLETDVEHSRFRRGFANLKSKVKAKQQRHHLHVHSASDLQAATFAAISSATAISTAAVKTMKETSPKSSRNPSPSNAASCNILRKRSETPVEQAEPASPTTTQQPSALTATYYKVMRKKNIKDGKKEVEIESGVEMLEDMVPPTTQTSTEAEQQQKKRLEMELPLDSVQLLESSTKSDIKEGEVATPSIGAGADAKLRQVTSQNTYNKPKIRDILKLLIQRMPFLILIGLIVVLYLPIHDFIRGVISCLLTIALLETFWSMGLEVVQLTLVTNPPEKVQFQIPDYSNMPLCELPQVIEHKTVKSYAGWMNETDDYDFATFHINMTRSVYVKLDGTMMQLFSTNARIQKRMGWNEPPIDFKTIVFTNVRTYNIFTCRIELLPLGLARKRFFNRKYPIQLIVKADPSTVPDPLDLVKKRKSKAKREAEALESSETKDKLVSAVSSAETLRTDQSVDHDFADPESELDLGSTVMSADLQSLQDCLSSEEDIQDLTVPRGDEVRLILFARGDREKEDWYRRFVAASTGLVFDQEIRLPNLKFISDKDMQIALAKAAAYGVDSTVKNAASEASIKSHDNHKQADDAKSTASNASTSTNKDKKKDKINVKAKDKGKDKDKDKDKEKDRDKEKDNKNEDIAEHENDKENDHVETDSTPDHDEFVDLQEDWEIEDNAKTFQGLLMSSTAARNPEDYLRFMSLYQRACTESRIPVHKPAEKAKLETPEKLKIRQRLRRKIGMEPNIWKGIDQSLYLGPSGSVVWANVLVGRVLFSVLHDKVLLVKTQEFLQKKLSALKLPSFMEDVIITHINLGNNPPLIHRISQPMLDERGTWVDADITYEGLLQVTVTTKLNLLRIKRNRGVNIIDQPMMPNTQYVPDVTIEKQPQSRVSARQNLLPNTNADTFLDASSSSAIYDSEAESSGESSTDSEAELMTTASGEVNTESPANARRLFKIVDRFTASNFFHYATELSYVQRAMENMNANITLRIDLKALVGRGTMNIPPPPSDRIWLSFRGPPRLWLTTKPAVGDKSVDWSIVTNVIESKLCDAVNKFLVFPSMVDLTIPLLGQPTYTKEQ